jgi:hypothetical protein
MVLLSVWAGHVQDFDPPILLDHSKSVIACTSRLSESGFDIRSFLE